LRVRLAAGAELPDDLVGLASTSRSDGFHILHLASGAQPQAMLQQIAANRVVEHFEIVRPSLHDIFVEIARPQESRRANA
jgi:ABC-2 type transport system ATP-binding protein